MILEEHWDVIYAWYKEPNGLQKIMKVTGMSKSTVRKFLADNGLRYGRRSSGDRDFKDPRELPECIRYSICPKCGRKLFIERVPWTQNWDVVCISCSRLPLPEGFNGQEEEGE